MSSLKEVATIMEREASSNKKLSDKEKLVTLLGRWRKKVYECLVTNKRYELVIEDNLKRFAAD